LPATDPDDTTYGTVPTRIATAPDVAVHAVRFPTMVWYNAAIREQAIAQILAFGVAPVVLVGFSKSGLGAWHIVQAIPERVSATILFDVPVARERLPPWGTAPFYADDAEWQRDLPIRDVARFADAVPRSHRLVLISGRSFHDEMSALARVLATTAISHVFLPRPAMVHHWQAGWIEEGLRALNVPAGDP
jgi:pimeloyl-ACP methyl ester carboxylesterase